MPLTRRRFLQSGALAGAAGLLPLPLKASGPKLKTALLGAGEAGQKHLQTVGLLESVEIVAICDPIAANALAASEQVAGHGTGIPRICHDYNRLIEQERPEIVVISTPDHWHLEQTVAALRGGARVLLETIPVRTFAEADALGKLGQQFRNRISIFAPWRFSAGLERARETVTAGELGELRTIEVHATRHASLPAGKSPSNNTDVHWDKWLGDASWPARGRARLLEKGWRNWRTFGCGFFSGEGFELLDQAWWVAGMPPVETIFAAGATPGIRSRNRTPAVLVASAKLAEGNLLWEHRTGPFAGDRPEGSSCVIRGTRGAIHWGADASVSFVSPGGQIVWSVSGVPRSTLELAFWKRFAETTSKNSASITAPESLIPSTRFALGIIDAWDSGVTINKSRLAA